MTTEPHKCVVGVSDLHMRRFCEYSCTLYMYTYRHVCKDNIDPTKGTA
jgi:hypothetical protein